MRIKTTNRQTHSKFQFRLKPAYAAVLLAFTVHSVQANPLDPTVVSGQASFASSGSTLTVTNTPGAIINWQGFSIGANEITRFNQQSASSAVLNRVISSNPSSILGTLQSNGRVFLINPNGIVFGAGAVVDVAGLVASTLNLSDADFLAGRGHFTEVPGAASISNAGDISAREGGQIFLIAPNVENTGVITAPNGEILLAAGHSIDLVSTNDPDLRVNITAPAGDATNVGQLIASSGSLGLFGTVVRNSGVVSADSATMQGGKIVFKASQRVEAGGTISAKGAGGGEIKMLSDMQTGIVSVTGTLDASAPNSGNGGFVETSAAYVHVADTARIIASATNGKAGEWLIDPLNVTINAATAPGTSGGAFVGGVWTPSAPGSYISNGTIQGALNTGTSVTITTVNAGYSEAGDINVNASITKTLGGAASLTLLAENNINFANGVGVSSTSGALNLVLHSDSDGSGAGTVTFAGTNAFNLLGGRADLYYNPVSYTDALTKSDSLTNPYSGVFTATPYTAWMLVNTDLQLQAMNTNLAGRYALGANINASGTSTWNYNGVTLTYDGFMPVGTISTPFTGLFDGVGHTIDGLYINRPTTSYVGLFGYTNASTIKNVLLTNVNISGNSYVGSLVGWHQGNLAFSSNASGSVTGTMDAASLSGNSVGGLVGMNYNFSTIDTCSSGSSVSGDNYVGGLVGTTQRSTISNSSTSGAVTGTQSYAGGLVGESYDSFINFGTASGNVNGVSFVGGLVGRNGYSSNVSNSSASGIVSGTQDVGGLVGFNASGIDTSFATGSVLGTTNVGGLVGNNEWVYGTSSFYTFGTISNSYAATGTVTGVTNVGGLVGSNTTTSNTITSSNASGNVTGNANVGGLVGYNGGTINLANASGSVTGSGTLIINLGGLVGFSAGGFGTIISNSFATGASVAGVGASNVGGLVGTSYTNITNCYAAGVSVSGANDIGGLVGSASGSINGSYVSVGAVTGTSNVGGLVGNNTGSLINSHYNINGVTVNGTNKVTLGGLYNDNTANAQGIGQYADWLLDKALYIADYTAVNGGSFGTDAAGYTISNIQGMKDLLGFADNYLYTFTLTGNIDLSPLPGFYVPEFAGIFNGAGNTISKLNLTILNSNLGLFGRNSGTVSNVVLVDAAVTGSNNVGALAGWNLGTINNSSVSASSTGGVILSGADFVGGMVGNNAGSITNGSVNGSIGPVSVTGVNSVGGLAGTNSSFISTSFATGVTVAGASNVGGLVGNNVYVGVISNSYVSTGAVTAAVHNVGGLVGFENGGTRTNSYFNIDAVTTNGGNNVTAGGLYNTAGTGQFNDWLNVGIPLTPLVIGDYSASLVLQGDGSYGIGDMQGMKDMLGFADDPAAYNFSLTATNINLVPSYYVPKLVGSFNGKTFTLSNLSLTLPNDDMGLFGVTNTTSLVSNINLVNASVSGYGAVGALVGRNFGNIDNTSVTGIVSVAGVNSGVGGLVGQNNGGSFTTLGAPTSGIISNSYVTGGTVTGSKGDVGGLVGYNNQGNIDTSHVDNSTVSGSGNVGGLVGYNLNTTCTWCSVYPRGMITNSYVTNGSVTGTGGALSSAIGGLVGLNMGGNISSSRALNPTVNGGLASIVGGLVGQNKGGVNSVWQSSASTSVNVYFGAISNSYVSGGTVSSTGNDVGGLVGNNFGALIDLSHVDTVNVTGKLNVGGLVGYDSGEGWGGGLGKISNSYALNTQVTGESKVGGLIGIVAAPTTFNSNDNFDAVINSYVSGGTVTSNASTTLASAIGGLVGYNSLGNINGSYVTGTGINGGLASDVGGLVGYNIGSSNSTFTGTGYGTVYRGLISNSYVSGGTVSGKANVGGLAGYNIGSINNSYVKGSAITGTLSVGGLVGYNIVSIPTTTYAATFVGNISNSYISGGTVSGSNNVGGVIGYNDGAVSSTFWDTVLTSANLTNGIGYDLFTDGGTDTDAVGLTAAGMMTMSNFTGAGWSIANTGGAGSVWRIYDDYSGQGYTTPLLTSFLKPLVITADPTNKFYDGATYSGGLVNPSYTTDGVTPVVPNLPDILGTANAYGLNAINEGTYDPALYSGQMGYDISYVGGKLTVNTASLFTIPVPTVINEIVNTGLMFSPDTGSSQSTSSSDEEDKAAEEVLADADIKQAEGTAGQPLPVCN